MIKNIFLSPVGVLFYRTVSLKSKSRLFPVVQDLLASPCFVGVLLDLFVWYRVIIVVIDI